MTEYEKKELVHVVFSGIGLGFLLEFPLGSKRSGSYIRCERPVRKSVAMLGLP